MFQMLTCFDLKPEFSIEEFEQSLADYTEHMYKLDLIESNGPIGLRQSDCIMDTDDERNHQYFVLMNFRDKAQSDKAVDYIKTHQELARTIHELPR